MLLALFFFFAIIILVIVGGSSKGDCQVTPETSTQLVTTSDNASNSDWTKKGTVANKTAEKVFKAWVSKGLSGASASGIVGWVNSEGGFAMIGRAEGHYGSDLKTNSIAFGVRPSGLAYYTTEAGGGIYQFTPYTKYAPMNDPKWEDEDSAAKLTKSFEKILIEVIILFMVIPRKINFTQLGRYGSHVEQTYRNAFGLKKSKSIDWLKLNASLAKRFFGKQGRCAIAIDPTYISKAGKKTPHIGRFLSGCSQSVKNGLEKKGNGLIE